MDKLAWYLLTSGICLGVLLLPYRFWLSKLTHFQWNRTYLLAALGLSLLLPWPAMQLDPLSGLGTELSVSAGPEVEVPAAEALPAPALNADNVPADQAAALPAQPNHVVTPFQKPVPTFQSGVWLDRAKYFLWGVYFLGLTLGLIGLGKGIFQVIRLFMSSPKEKQDRKTLVYPDRLPGSFSFFRLLFLSADDKTSQNRPTIEAHETAHIRQWHSLDVLLAEIACRMWWFMPWSRYLRTSLRETHEYLADQEAAQSLATSIGKAAKVAYSKLVLSQVAPTTAPLPVHYFAQSKTTKRIKMLNRTPSSGKSRYIYLGIIPVLLIAFSLMACIPAPEVDTTMEATEAISTPITFAGEDFPDDVTFRTGLKQQIGRLKQKPDYCQKIYLRGQRFKAEIGEQLSDEGIPADFFYLAIAESNLDAQAVSSMGACGVWQFMPKTAQSYGMNIDGEMDERQDLTKSTQSAAAYLKDQFKTFESWTASALAYNRGPKAVRDANPDRSMSGYYTLDHERGYLYRILAMKKLMEEPEIFGISASPEFTMPLAKRDLEKVSSDFGPRISPLDGKMKNHTGVDLVAEMGAEVLAVADGVVKVAEVSEKKVGNHIQIDHGGTLDTRYNHLQDVRVEAGEMVKRGQVIGTIGTTGLSTGPHLHLEVREAGVAVNPGLYLRY